VPLASLLGAIAPSVLNLRGAARPRHAATGRADAAAVAAACERAAVAAAAGEAEAEPLTLNVSGETSRGAPPAPAWGDAETEALVRELLEARPAAAARLGELWVHHSDIGDACAALRGPEPRNSHFPMKIAFEVKTHFSAKICENLTF